MKVLIPKSLVSVFIKTWNSFNRNNLINNQEDINKGWCYQFAVAVKYIFPQAEIYSDLEAFNGHCWVKIDSYYYDFDHLGGCDKPLNMSKNFKCVSEEQLKEIWNDDGFSGRIQFDILKIVLEKFIKIHGRIDNGLGF